MFTRTLRRFVFWLLLAGVTLGSVPGAHADSPPLGPIPAEASGPNIDPIAATRAYLATIPPEAKANSDAYFEGGYWLILWNALLGVGISGLLLATRWSAAWRDRATSFVRWPWVQVVIYAVIFTLATTVLSFPMTVYQNFYREHQYHMATQTFGPWFSEQITGLVIQIITAAILLPILYTVFRRTARTWWIWGSMVIIIFLVVSTVIQPTFIDPRFNTYQTLEEPGIRDPILAMARANQIPVEHVYEFDASRQTTRVSANVSGAFGVARINLNDNLIKRCSLPEIRQVMAHEMGHYVLNHVYKLLFELSCLIILFALATRSLFDAALRRWGTSWRVEGIADSAGFPLLVLILTVLGFLCTPILNSLIRETEGEADSFGINTSREPDGFAQSAIKLGQYRKMDPSPIEEVIFFDHPSGRARIMKAMEWKAAHLPAGTQTP